MNIGLNITKPMMNIKNNVILIK